MRGPGRKSACSRACVRVCVCVCNRRAARDDRGGIPVRRHHRCHHHHPRSHFQSAGDPAVRRALKMLPLSIKDDEYKPPKFNLLGKISGWFRCGVPCVRGVGTRSRLKRGPWCREGGARVTLPWGLGASGEGGPASGSRPRLDSRAFPTLSCPGRSCRTRRLGTCFSSCASTSPSLLWNSSTASGATGNRRGKGWGGSPGGGDWALFAECHVASRREGQVPPVPPPLLPSCFLLSTPVWWLLFLNIGAHRVQQFLRYGSPLSPLLSVPLRPHSVQQE